MLESTCKEIGRFLKIDISLEEFKRNMVTSYHRRSIYVQDTMMVIDIKKYKISLLKIAYEFAVDNIPDYYNDNMAILISQILYKADFEAINDSFFVDLGFDKNLFQGISFINTTSQNYYLFLIGHESYGTVCFIRLSTLFNVRVIVSNKNYLKANFILGVNDFQQQKFLKYQRSEIVKKLYLSTIYKFCYWFSSYQKAIEFTNLEKLINFDFYKINEEVPLFDKNGKIVYESIEIKLFNIPSNLKKIR